MISFQVYVPSYAGAYVEGTCLSTDTLPVVGFVTGSKMKILDAEAGTVTEAMYDTESMSWINLVTEEVTPDAGGGGADAGGGDAGGADAGGGT